MGLLARFQIFRTLIGDIPLEYMWVTYHKIAEEYPKPKLNEKQRETFKKFFKTDILLYERFNNTLHEKIAAFGHERLVTP